jgi:hypothetical protein
MIIFCGPMSNRLKSHQKTDHQMIHSISSTLLLPAVDLRIRIYEASIKPIFHPEGAFPIDDVRRD